MPGVNWFQSTQVNPNVLLGIAVGLAVLIFLLIYGTYRYQRWRQYRRFVDEMKILDLDPSEENTLGDMVRRYAMREPVQILYSQRMFDELACKEMQRILASAGSADIKEQFIDTLYEIRTKTYDQSWLPQVPQAGSTEAA